MQRTVVTALAALALLLPAAARADEVTDAMQEAMRTYQAGDPGAARMAMQEALQLLSQRAAAALAAALPKPLAGWTADEAEAKTSELTFMGGGAQASRRYRNAGGEDVEIQVVADSPVLAQLGMIMNNPAMAGAMGKLIRIGSQRAIQTSSNEIQMMVNNRIMVTVNGSAPMEAKLAYATAIDITKLSAGK